MGDDMPSVSRRAKMTYKSLMTVISTETDSDASLDAAIALARSEDAHLDVICLGIDRTQMDVMSYSGAGMVLMPSMMDQARDEAEALAEKTRARLNSEDIRWSVETYLAPMAALGGVIGPLARYSDLLIAHPPRDPKGGGDSEAIVEAALFDGNIPVLVVPRKTEFILADLHVMIAWNDSDVAMSAVRAAMPILKSAKMVSVAVIAPPVYGAERSDPAGALAQMLSRHDIHANINVLAKSGDPISTVLLRQARDIDANLIVMGAYGHSRLRETLLGGATRDMLEKTTTPVFMAH
jgi:nucleotide-binding universal stress UspA family protein